MTRSRLSASCCRRPPPEFALSSASQMPIPLGIVLAVALLVLLIACANIANLLIARGVRRQGEIGMRLAIGCGRARLIRQLLTESLVLSTLGAAAGVGVARTRARRCCSRWSAFRTPRFDSLCHQYSRVLIFLMAVVFVTGIGFGIAPALRASRVNQTMPLAARGGRGAVATPPAIQSDAATIQVAVSLLLLVGTGLFAGSLRNLYATNWGFSPEHIIVFDLQHTPRRTDPTALARVAEDIRTRVTAIPGVESASVSWILLFSSRDQRTPVRISSFTPPPRTGSKRVVHQ